MWYHWWERARGGELVRWAWVGTVVTTDLLCILGHMTSSLCTFPEGLIRDNNSQRILWAEGTACAKALR